MAKPQDVIGVPVIFNDRATIPVIGDFRYAKQNMMIFSDWNAREDGTGPVAWAREYWKTLEPATRGVYINEMDAADGAAVVNANFLQNYPRLAGLKRRYDPANLFRMNANITPT